MEQTIIRKGSPADIPAIIAIIQQTWEATYKPILGLEQVWFMKEAIYSPTALEEQMAAGQDFYLLFSCLQPVGFASCSLAGLNLFKLHKLYVVPGFQKHGFGKLLIAHTEQVARQAGAIYLTLNVNRHNNAKDFYEKLGYRVIREEDIPIGEYLMNDYVMQKTL